jgi:hypothetical protein
MSSVNDREQLEKAEDLILEILIQVTDASSDWDSMNNIYFLVKRYQEEKIQKQEERAGLDRP